MTSKVGPICLACKHWAHDTKTCKAYPIGIPAAIWENEADHRMPQRGDHGIIFEPKDAAGERYAEHIFDGDLT